MTVRTLLGSAVAAALLATALSANAAAAADDAKQERSRVETQKKLEEAQQRLDAAAREVANLSMSLSDAVVPPHVWPFAGDKERGSVLGMVIGSPAYFRANGDAGGVPVLSVSPGGGAADAGLKAGDVVTEINGTTLAAPTGASADQRLREIMRTIDPGQKVTLKYVRDGKPATAIVTTREPPDRSFRFNMPGPEVFAQLPSFAFTRADGVFGAAEFVSLTPKLGQYFGTDQGLLVVRAPSDTRLRLEEGDVVVDIDGRVPSSPAHALQILASYQPGEKLKLNVLRMKKRLSFDITVPENEGPRLQSQRFRLQAPAVAVPAVPPVPPLEAGPQKTVIVSGPDEPI